jgi:hypothetical protein
VSLAERPYGQGLCLLCDGQGLRLVWNGTACGRKFNPRRPRPADEQELRRRAELYGWTSKPLAPGYRYDFCPEHKTTAGERK